MRALRYPREALVTSEWRCAMARYRLHEHASGITIELSDVGDHQRELLEAFGECQSGRCSCPTDQYENVAAMDVDAGEGEISIRLEAKPQTRFAPEQVSACLDPTIAKVADETDRQTKSPARRG